MSYAAEFSSFIETVLASSAEIALSHFGSVSTTQKGSDINQVLTQADLEIGRHIIAAISQRFPQHNIIDEEAGVIDNQSSITWVVDPIDGTSNFAAGLPTYGVMMGVMIDGEPVAGGISLPAFNQVYVAQQGRGAFCNGEKVVVNPEQELSKMLIAYGIDGHRENPSKTVAEMNVLSSIILNCRNIRTTNSAYDMVQIPAGRYGAYLNQSTKVWDNVALQPLVEEAGGIVTDFWGVPLDYTHTLTNPEQNMTICVASPTLHAQLQTLIHSV